MPIGPRFDKVTKLGNQHLNIFGGTYNNAESIADTGKWYFKLNVSLLIEGMSVFASTPAVC